MPKKKSSIEEIVRLLRQMFNTYKGTYIADEGVKTDYVTVVTIRDREGQTGMIKLTVHTRNCRLYESCIEIKKGG